MTHTKHNLTDPPLAGRCLLITEDKDIQTMLGQKLKHRNYHTTIMTSIKDVNQVAIFSVFNAIFLDMDLSGLKGLDLLQDVKKSSPLTEVVVIVDDNSMGMNTGVEALRLDALEIITKPINPAHLETVLKLLKKKLTISNHRLVTDRLAKTVVRFPLIIQESQGMKNLLAQIERVAPSDTPILLLGESGSGKDLIARTIHQESHRKEYPFFAISCAGFTSTLLESELFGHEKGAFTGADKLQHGLFEVANGGTIFLDEIGDLSLDGQSKLLRILESGEFRRVGGNVNLYTDVRLICSTNQDLETLIKAHKLRQDLYYRINTIVFNIPSLRERKEDIRGLAEYFLKIIGQEMNKKRSFSQEVLHIFESYHWPGNVRQLRNTIESFLLLTDSPTIQVTDLPHWLFKLSPEVCHPAEGEEDFNIKEGEKQLILKALKKTRDNRREAARLLGIDESTLYRKLKEYGIE